MKITKHDAEDRTVIALEGELDLKTSPELTAFLNGNLDGVTDLELDFSGLRYLSSAGMRVILNAQKIMNSRGRMRITHVNDFVMEIFSVAGFDAIMDVSR